MSHSPIFRKTILHGSKSRYQKVSLKLNQRGSSLVLALFIIVVMSLLGAAMLRMMSTSSETIAYEVVGTRAYQAANIGLQQGLTQIFPLHVDPNHCDGIATTATANGDRPLENWANITSFNSVTGLMNCRAVSITCDDIKIDDVTYYRIESTGQCNIGDEVTSRTVAVEARTL